MVKHFLLVGLAFIGGSAVIYGQEQPRPPTPDELPELERYHQKDAAAVRAADIETLTSLWTDDAVALPTGTKPVVGQPAIRDWLRKNRMDITEIEVSEYVVDVQETKITGDLAIERARRKMTVKPKGIQSPGVTVSGNIMLLLRRQPDGSWKVWRSIWNQETP